MTALRFKEGGAMTTRAPKSPIAGPATDDADDFPTFPLVGPLRLNLAALGVDHSAPDFNERFFRFANDNYPYTLEHSGQGELIVMPPTGSDSNKGEQGVNAPLFFWDLDNPGQAYSQTVMFHLPSGARYMPDASWIPQERYDNLTASERSSAINGAPDFVIEVHSRSDSLASGLAKMQEWMDAGCKLGWYIHPYQRRVYVYRAGREVETLENPDSLSGEDVLPGFALEVRRLMFDRYE